MTDINNEWEAFLNNNSEFTNNYDNCCIENTDNNLQKKRASIPTCGELYISTKTKIAYFNKPIDLFDIFWKLEIQDYHIPKEGIIKKQMKFSSSSPEELDVIKGFLAKEKIVDEHVIMQIINPNGRIKYKDTRKISIGLSKKDIISVRSKKKSAFYNCFVVIIRVLYKEIFKELHVKVFNTGKMEIPGIQDDSLLFKTLDILCGIINKISPSNVVCVKDNIETVLINSNFNCGFYIDRDRLFKILKYDYKINCTYDPCSYPGIQCEFYYDKNTEKQDTEKPFYSNGGKINKTNKVSFMIFRTGSVLIVGKCTEIILKQIFEFIKTMLHNNYHEISIGIQDNNIKKTNPKPRRTKCIKLIK